MGNGVFCCGFECGLTGTGTHWTTAGSTPANSTIQTTTKRTGNRAGRVNNTTSTTSYFATPSLSGTSTVAIRFYWRMVVAPTTGTPFIFRHGGSDSAGVRYHPGTGQLRAFAGSTEATSGPVVTTGQWYQVNVKIDASVNPHKVDIQVDGVAGAQAQNAVAGTTIGGSGYWFGMPTNAAIGEFLYDDILCHVSGSTDYPLLGGRVDAFVPTSDGTHLGLAAGEFKKGTAGADILGTTTDAYTMVDDVPLKSAINTADLISLIAPSAATDYVEVKFGPAPGFSVPTIAPRHVEIIAAVHQASTAAGSMELRLVDATVVSAFFSASGLAGVTSLAYKRQGYGDPPSAASNWTLTGNGNFNDVRLRFGSPATVDAVPDQYLDSVMIEAEIPDNVAPTIVLNTTDDNNFGTDTTPTIEATATDAYGSDVRYEIVSVGPFETANIIDSFKFGSLNSITGPLVGQTITGNGGTLGSVVFPLSRSATGGTLTVKIYAITGTHGTNGAPTGSVLATSDAVNISSLPIMVFPETNMQGIVFTFSGGNQIVLTNGVNYAVALDIGSATGGSVWNLRLSGASATHSGNGFEGTVGGSMSTYSTIDFGLYVLNTSHSTPTNLIKVSGTDAGFVNTVDGADTDPFTQAQKVSYTFQTELNNGRYEYSFRAQDTGSFKWVGQPTWRNFYLQGALQINLNTANNGIATGFVSGSPTVQIGAVSRQVTAIDGVEAFGTNKINRNLTTLSIDTGYISGTISNINKGLTTAGIGTDYASGALTVNRGAVSRAINSIVTAEAFGSPTVNRGAVSLTLSGLPSQESVGAATAPVVTTGTSSASGSGTSLTWSHTVPAGSNKLLVVGVTQRFAGESVTGITFNGVALTKLALGSAFSGVMAHFYYLVNPTSTTADIVVSFNSNTLTNRGAALNVVGVNQTTPFGTPVTGGSNSGSNPSLNVSASSTDLVVDVLGVWSTFGSTFTVGAQQTQHVNMGNQSYIAISTEAGAPTTTMSWNSSDMGNWSQVAVAIKPSSTGTVLNLRSSIPSIASLEAFGALKLNRNITFLGSASAETFGTVVVNQYTSVTLTGMSSAESVNNVTVNRGSRTLTPTSITSLQAFGTLTVNRGSVSRAVTSIASAESVNNVTVNRGAVSRSVTSITSAETFGTLVVNRGATSRLVNSVASSEVFGALTVNRGALSRQVTGIASLESVNNVTVNRGAVSRAVTSIASAEAFGTLTVNRGSRTLAPTSIASAQTFGSPTINRGAASRQVTSITSSESVNNVTVNRGSVSRSVTSIASAEAFGTLTVNKGAVSRSVTGISSLESVSNVTVNRGAVSRNITSITSAESFGALVISSNAVQINLTGITSAQEFGTLTVNRGAVSRQVTGISSLESVNNVTINRGAVSRNVTSIASAEAFGTLSASINSVQLVLTGIAPAQTFGTIKVNRNISLTGIATSYVNGAVTVNRGSVTVTTTSIASLQEFGAATINRGSVSRSVTGIASTEALGTHTINRGAVSRSVTAIPSAEAFGAVKVNRNLTLTGIASAQTFGVTTVNRGSVSLQPTGISSAEAFGTYTINRGAVSRSITSISSAEAFGNLTVNRGSRTITTTGVASSEAFGTVKVNRNVTFSGITSAQAFGTVKINRNLTLTSIASAQAFGTVTINRGSVSILLNGIATSYESGGFTITTGAGGVYPAGITTGYQSGTLTINKGSVNVVPTSIATGFVSGTLNINRTVSFAGVSTSYASGALAINRGIVTVIPTSIESSYTSGALTISTGAVSISISAISTGFVAGSPTISRGSVTLSPTSVGSGFIAGSPTVQRGSVNLGLSSINSAQIFGNAVLQTSGWQIYFSGIEASYASGNLDVQRGSVTLSPVSTVSAESFGSVALTVYKNLYPVGTASTESVNNVTTMRTVPVSSVLSVELFGTLMVQPQGVFVSLGSITSTETFGTISISNYGFIGAAGIPSAEAFGTLNMQTAWFVTPSSIVSQGVVNPAKVIFKYQAYLGGEYKKLRILKNDTDNRTKFIKITSNFKKLD